MDESSWGGGRFGLADEECGSDVALDKLSLGIPPCPLSIIPIPDLKAAIVRSKGEAC